MQRHIVDDAVQVRFATAYSFKTLQRILHTVDENELEYDYIESRPWLVVRPDALMLVVK